MMKKTVKLRGLAEFLEEQDIAGLIRLNLFLFIGIAAVALTGFIVFRDAGWAHFAKNGLLLVVGSTFIMFLLRQKRISLAAYLSLFIYTVILIYSAWTGAGVKGTIYSLFFLLVVGAALFMGRRGGYITALIAILLGLILLLAGRAGLLVNIDRPSVDLVTWVTLSVGFLIAAHLVSLVIKQAERAIAAAQSEVAERIRAEVEVRRLNSELEKALGEKERRFRRVFEISPVAIVVTTLAEGRLVEANDAYWKLSGHDPKTSIGKTTLELRPEYDAGRRQDFVAELIEKKSIKNPSYVFVDDAGTHRYTMAFHELIDLDGQLTILSMFYDMTEQIDGQNALQRSEEHVRGLLNAIPDAIFEIRRDGLVLQYIPSDESSSAQPSEEFLGKSIDQIMPAAVAEQIMFAVGRALESGLLHVIEYQLPEAGTAKTYEARVAVNGASTVLMIVREVSLHRWLETERESMIEELEKRNAESESLRETTVIVTSTLDISETVQRILRQLKRVIAYDSASVWLYKNTTAHLVGGDGIPDIPEQDKHFPVNETEPDYPFWVQNIPYILLADIQADYAQFRNPPINYIHGWLGVPLKVRGKLIGIISLDSRRVGHFTDDDAQLALNYANQVSVAVENARLYSDLQSELHQRQELIDELDAKNSELERFTYAVSHDLKSPLITIKGFLGFLNDDIVAGNASRVQADVQRISSAMEVMQQRLNHLLELSRVGRLTNKSEVMQFNDLIGEALELVHGRLSQRGITVRVEPNLPSITGDHHRLLEVLQNLVDNAAKFMGDQANPLIEIGQRGEDAERGQPIFFVKDNGMGIPPEHHEKIFGIFNKLDPGAEGTGIGLSLVKKIIEVHGGRIRVESEAGKGSTFYFSLPCL